MTATPCTRAFVARLSGEQRIGVARALYHDPEVLVLDEATSALDHETERAVMGAVEHLRGSRTILLIAHRLTTVEACDAVVRLHDGRAEAGEPPAPPPGGPPRSPLPLEA